MLVCCFCSLARYPTQAIGAGAQCYLDFFPDGTPDGTNNGPLELEVRFLATLGAVGTLGNAAETFYRRFCKMKPQLHSGTHKYHNIYNT